MKTKDAITAVKKIIAEQGVEMRYQVDGYYIPDRMMPAIDRYINDRVKPGDFLQAIIRNDLFGTFGAADRENMENIRAYLIYFHNEAPSQCWGSRHKMEAWLFPEVYNK